VNEPKQAPSLDEAELAARVEAATRPAPWTPNDHPRFRIGVEARIAQASRARTWWALGLAASAAVVAIVVLAVRTPAPPSRVASTSIPTTDLFVDSYEEEVLFAPEWLEHDDGFVDAEVLPDDYALVSALIES
jgi:hypothetical protein